MKTMKPKQLANSLTAAFLSVLLVLLPPVSCLCVSATEKGTFSDAENNGSRLISDTGNAGSSFISDTENNGSSLISDAEATDSILISDAEDLTALFENCETDTWSVGKTVLLANDIDLAGTSLAETRDTFIPTFGGIFLGQNHTISGISLKGGSDHTGFFR